MKRKLKQLFKSTRVIILLIALVLSILAINPALDTSGVAVRAVAKNSSAEIAGIEKPKPTLAPRSREIILTLNNRPINTMDDYTDAVLNLEVNQTIFIKTNRKTYRLTTLPVLETVYTGIMAYKTVFETILMNRTEGNDTIFYNETINRTVEYEILEYNTIGMQNIGLTVYPKPKTNIRKGLDLEGGTRVWLKPEEKLSLENLDILIANMEQRLNVYGLSDLTIRDATDLSGDQYILVEIAGASEQQVKDLLSRQGKFEAKIGNSTVFYGGNDITNVCRTAECSGIDPGYGCREGQEGWGCRFMFSITLSPEAASRQAAATQVLEVLKDEDNDGYLSQNLDLYLDDELVQSLRISEDLKGRETTEIAITGFGSGITQQEAQFQSLQEMKTLQTILITGSLPVKLEIVKTDSLSPLLGKEFVKNAFTIGVLAILTVGVIVYIRYRKFAISIPMALMSFSEAVLLLGIASLIGWNIDLAAVAGIIVAIGTGVDHQIVITDETLKGETRTANWKEKIKRAFFIIMGSYFTTVVAMIPLIFAGAGLLKGFAITTILGVSIGVFITRPAFAAIIEVLLKDY